MSGFLHIWQAILDGMHVFLDAWLIVLGSLGIFGLGSSLAFGFLGTKSELKPSSRRQNYLLPLFLFFVISVLLRLAFVSNLLAPPYYDSVQHFRIIKDISTAIETTTVQKTIPGVMPRYYHLGFHFLAAFLVIFVHSNPMDVMLILGQIILATIPIPVFFLVYKQTYSRVSGFFAAFLAGFGWYMPGFAVNWGKYPALTGLLALEVVLVMLYSIFQENRKQNKYVQYTILLLGIVASTLIHSRTLVVVIATFASWLIAGKIVALSKPFQYYVLGSILIGIAIFEMVIQGELYLSLALEPYLKDGLWSTVLVLILSLFALVKTPRGVFHNFLLIFFLLVCLFVPFAGILPGYVPQTLLDRPFVEMALYLPLSILGGLGLSGFIAYVKEKVKNVPKANFYVNGLILILLFGYASALMISYTFSPGTCCNFLKQNDKIALDWINENTSPDAQILIAWSKTTIMSLDMNHFDPLFGVDAGIWVSQLTGRNLLLAPSNLDFHAAATLEELCKISVDYIFVGSNGQGFRPMQLREKPDWYAEVLSLPDVWLFQLTGCPPTE